MPGHFWVTDRKGFADSLDYFDQMGELAQQAIVDGLDPDDFAAISRYTSEQLERRFGQLFRFDEYCAMNLARYMQHFLTGGWGIEGNLPPTTTPF